jgi:acyl carrier protein
VTSDDLKQVVIEALRRIAPETNAASIEAGASLREELDLDSMDFLNFVLSLHERLGVDIPEADYPRLYTLNGALEYLSSKKLNPRRD